MTPTIPDGTLVAVDQLQVMHADLTCGHIQQPIEVGPFPTRSGFVCTCIDDKTGIDFTAPPVDPRLQPTDAPSLDNPYEGTTASPGSSHPKVTDDEVVALIKALPYGEKFDRNDMTPGLVFWAQGWLKAYTGDFEFLVDVRDNLGPRGLSDGQAKGVMNCVRAAFYRGDWPADRKAPAAGPETSDLDLSEVPAGFYAVPDGDTRLKVRIDQPTTGRWAGYTFVKDGAEYGQQTRYGMQKPGQTYRGRIEDQLRTIAADPEAAMAAYGHLVGRCGACNRKLENEESIERGIGPVCAAKAGW